MVKDIAKVALEFGAISLCAVVAAYQPYVILPAAWVAGSRLHALGELGHSASHRQLTGNKSVDAILAKLCFSVLAIDYDKYKNFHFAHHRHLGTDKDPEVKLQLNYTSRWTKYRLRDSLADALGLTTGESLGIFKEMASIKSTVVFIAILLAIFAAFGWIAIFLPLAMVTGLPLAHRLRAWTEHRHLTNPGNTLIKTKPALWKRVWFLPHNTWLHYEHHGYK